MSQPVAFVTGASTGIGFESAKKLASNGFTVYARGAEGGQDGTGAAAILALRRILPDRVYDAAVMAVLKRVAR